MSYATKPSSSALIQDKQFYLSLRTGVIDHVVNDASELGSVSTPIIKCGLKLFIHSQTLTV